MSIHGAEYAGLRTLIISSSGGGGHLSAAESKKSEKRQILNNQITKISNEVVQAENLIDFLKRENERENAPLIKSLIKFLNLKLAHQQKLTSLQAEDILQFDLLLDWAPFGELGVQWNNDYARKGDIKRQSRLTSLQGVANTVFGPAVFKNLVKALIATDAEHVIDTQALNTQSICRAIRYVNWLNRKEIKSGQKKKIKLTKVMTDMPTPFASHFFSSIKGLSKADKAIMTLQTAPPLLSLPEGVTEASLSDKALNTLRKEFWEKYLGNIEHLNIVYQEFPLRPGFYNKELTDRENIEENGLFVRCNNQDEEVILNQFVESNLAQWENTEEISGVRVLADQNCRVMSLMLGSTGGVAMFDYIDIVITRMRYNQAEDTPHFFYLFCGRHLAQGDLYDQVVQYIKEKQKKGAIPHNLFLVPLGGQNDTEIAPIYARADTVIVRPGGLSSMEVYAVVKPEQQLLLHGERTGFPKNEKDWIIYLVKGMIRWEKGNTFYLIAKREADVINPERMSSLPLNFLSSNSLNNTMYVETFTHSTRDDDKGNSNCTILWSWENSENDYMMARASRSQQNNVLRPKSLNIAS